MNLLMISGRVGRDAEQRTIPSGTTLLSFPIAVDTGYGDNKTTQWFRATIFGKRAEGALGQYLVKGQQVVVTGEVKLNEYQNAEGETKANMELTVDKLDLVGSKPEQEAAPAPQPAPVQQAPVQQAPTQPAFDDTVPF